MMGKFIVQKVDCLSGEVLDEMVDNEKFDTYEEAEEFSLICSESFAAGAEVLELAGRDFTDPDEIDFVVEEIN